MRIAKNGKVVGSEEMMTVELVDVGPYQCAIDNIMNAIECLGDLAKGNDNIARDAIANLSVGLLDLKSN